MEDLINDSIIESISEKYQIYKMTCETIPTKYVIRDLELDERFYHKKESN